MGLLRHLLLLLLGWRALPAGAWPAGLPLAAPALLALRAKARTKIVPEALHLLLLLPPAPGAGRPAACRRLAAAPATLAGALPPAALPRLSAAGGSCRCPGHASVHGF